MSLLKDLAEKAAEAFKVAAAEAAHKASDLADEAKHRIGDAAQHVADATKKKD